MINIKEYIKNKLIESILDEAAMGLNDLPQDASLFVKDNGTWVNFILYSKSEDKLYGVITIEDLNKDGNIRSVGRVAAEKGYGPMMYEIAMAYINPSFLMPSRDGDIRNAAWEVWKKFYQRNDVNKKTLDIQDELFSFVIVTGDSHEDFESPEEKQELYDGLSTREQHDTIVFNTMYQYRNPMILKLIYKADEQLNNKEVDMNDLGTLAVRYFENKYD
jgi:hypothetical protein